MNYLVSIIIPVYNAEKYIERCLKSVLKQTYRNIEIVIIDDGSIDSSLEKIKSFDDKRIHIYIKENGGVSSARNLGIEKSTGDYLLFVDADDYINEVMVENLINEVKGNSDLIFCNNYEIYKNRVDNRILFKELKDKINKKDVIREVACGRAGLVCSKLASSKVIKENKIKFDEKLVIGEDQIFFLKVAENTKSFKYINKSLYYYDRTNEESATLRYQENLYDNFSRLQEQVEVIFKRNELNSKEDKILLNDKVLSFLWSYINNEIKNYRSKEVIGNIKNTLRLVENAIDFDLVTENKLNKLMIKLIRYNNGIYIMKIIVFIKLLKIKSNLINRLRGRNGNKD